MDEFRVYLPSNSSTNLFPLNTSSNYTVSFNQPIILNVELEVGVESIFYKSQIKSTAENGSIDLSAYAFVDDVSILQVYPFKYKPTKDGKQNYDWYQIDSDYYGDEPSKMIIYIYI